MQQKKLLLHTCCAPCICYVYEVLITNYEVSAYFYNPNIMPITEHDLRLEELIKFSKNRGFPVIYDEPNTIAWINHIKKERYLGEKSERCWKCYEFRLKKTFEKAMELDFDIVATSLSISPHKISEKINQAGRKLSQESGIEFLEANFKKNNGFKKSVEMSKELKFYRQNYCGCIYSKMERDPESSWSKKMKAINNKEKIKTETMISIDFGKELDLHHFHPEDTKKIVLIFLSEAVKKGFSTVRIIHGKGKSQKKQQVHALLKEHSNVIIFRDDSYNWGATIIDLKT